jgi:hypothetical protein
LCAFAPAFAQETQPPFSRPRTVAAQTPAPARTAQTPSPARSTQPAAPTWQPPTQGAPAPSQATTQPATAAGQTPNGAAQSPAQGPVIVPALPAPLPLQPAKTLSPNKVRAHRTEAEHAFKSRVTLTAMTQPPLGLVTVAALDPEDSRLHLITLAKDSFLRAGSELNAYSSLGTPLRVRVVRTNYVNTAIVVSDFSGRQFLPLLVEYPIEKFGRYKEMAYYTSAHPALVTPELVKAGQGYVRTMVDLAARRLKDKGIHIAPEMLDMAERLCLVEHVDHERFRRESRRALFEEIYALYALNELDTYRYSVSSAGAGGMVQMISETYRMLRQRYPAVGLNPDFVLGMRNHGNALEAMLLYIRDTWSDLNLNADVADALMNGTATKTELMAAGYNSNPARLGSYLRRGGTGWRALIPRETQMYLQILQSVETTLPIKPRAGKDDREKATPTATADAASGN